MMTTTIDATFPTHESTKDPRAAERDASAMIVEELLSPQAAATTLLGEFRRMSRALSPRDPSSQDDLVQEMCLAALLCKRANTRSFYISAALWRAKDYLRWWISGQERLPREEERATIVRESNAAC